MKKLVLLVIYFLVSNVYAQENVSYDDRAFYNKGSEWNIGFSVGALLYDQLHYSIYYSSTLTNEETYLEAGQRSISQTAPLFTIFGEYKPNTSGASLDATLMYTQHKISELNDDVASLNKVALLVGGDWHFGETNTITPYVTLDFGLAFNNVVWREGYLPVGSASGSVEEGEEDDTVQTDRANGFSLGSANSDDDVPGEGTSGEGQLRVSDIDNWATSMAGQLGAGVNFQLNSVELGLLYNYILTNKYSLMYEWTQDDVDYSTQFNIDALGGHRIGFEMSMPVEIFKYRKR